MKRKIVFFCLVSAYLASVAAFADDDVSSDSPPVNPPSHHHKKKKNRSLDEVKTEKAAPSAETAAAPAPEQTSKPVYSGVSQESVVVKESSRPSSFSARLVFSNYKLDGIANGTGTIGSTDICPGLDVGFNHPLSSKWDFLAKGSLSYAKFSTTSTVDSFDAPSPTYWSLGAGAGYWVNSDFEASALIRYRRRIFVHREASLTLTGDMATLPEVGIGGNYRLYQGNNSGLHLGLGAGYLFGGDTTYAQAQGGYSLTGELTWEQELWGHPWSFGFNAERISQNTANSTTSFWSTGENNVEWQVGVLVGVQFGSASN